MSRPAAWNPNAGTWCRFAFRTHRCKSRLTVVNWWESIPPEFGRPSESPRFGDPDDTFQGLIDEFVFRTRVRENGPEFRGGIRALFGVPQIVLDRHGLLDSAVHQAGVPVELQEFDETFASFVVGRFTEEVQP